LDMSFVSVGTFMVTVSHLNSKLFDLGVITVIYSVEQFLAHRQSLGRSQDEEENFIGIAHHVATESEALYLPVKLRQEIPVLEFAKRMVSKFYLHMDLYEAEFQFD